MIVRAPGQSTIRRPLSLTTAALALATGVMVAPAATAQDADVQSPPEVPGEIDRQVLAESVSAYDVPKSISVFDVDSSIEELGGADPDEEDVIVLEADILFVPMKWDLPGSASDRIAALVDQVPEGATVDVHGHTDSLPMPEGSEVDNDGLSEHRAQAVADVLAAERPDLTLAVEGFGDSQPAVAEDPDDPSSLAANRRVEISFG
ncbi:hypothetical protein GCM10025784_01670 [Citricoccus nitrophenolicus]